ncbi:respiratory burst oxidase protein A-like, partial [Trifolium medium]|nr:respiratory burst oxidase protein A-like [Trifolium medium]
MLRRLSHEMNAKAKQFSQELKAELRRFSLSHAGSETALTARDLRKQRAQHDRNRSAAKKALRGLKFI